VRLESLVKDGFKILNDAVDGMYSSHPIIQLAQMIAGDLFSDRDASFTKILRDLTGALVEIATVLEDTHWERSHLLTGGVAYCHQRIGLVWRKDVIRGIRVSDVRGNLIFVGLSDGRDFAIWRRRRRGCC